MSIRGRACIVAVIGALGMFLLGCNGGNVRESQSISPPYTSPGIIAVVPFLVGRPDTTGQRLARCPRCEGYISVGDIAPEGPGVVTNLFRQKLGAAQYNLVAPEMVAKALSSLRDLTEQPEMLVQQLAPEARADSVLIGWVFRYSERVGGALAVKKPASVAFVALLFQGKDAKLLWRGKFDETQKPLSENALNLASFFRRGGTWLTAKQLAADGTNRLLLTFPDASSTRR